MPARSRSSTAWKRRRTVSTFSVDNPFLLDDAEAESSRAPSPGDAAQALTLARVAAPRLTADHCPHCVPAQRVRPPGRSVTAPTDHEGATAANAPPFAHR